MNVLSLFDGMSCGRVALERCGFKINKYYASEIDKYAITVAANNYLDTIHIGDVTQVRAEDLDPIDLVIGGSPCQGFSFAGKQLNFEDPRSKLFFEFVRLVKECKPKYFFLENVVMKKEHQDVISGYLGVQPIMLNSSLVSAQSRKRLYWTNIPGYTPPEDKGILLKDIVHEHNDFSDLLTPNFNINPSGKGMNGVVRSVNNPKSNCLTTNKGEGQKIHIPKHKVMQINPSLESGGKQPYMQNRVFDTQGLSPCLTQLAGRTNVLIHEPKKLYVPEATKKGYAEINDGEGVDLTFINSKTRRGRRMETKSNCLTAAAYDYNFYKDGYIRKLTPIECERLQTLPDNYTAGVSNSQRYKMLGNGWTVDAVCEFFKHIPKDLDLF